MMMPLRGSSRLEGSDSYGSRRASTSVSRSSPSGWHVEWRISPKDRRNSVWLAQASIESEGSDEVGSFTACQAGLTSAVVPGMQVFLLGTDRNITPGMMLRLGVTGYVKVGEDPHVQFCFEVRQPAE